MIIQSTHMAANNDAADVVKKQQLCGEFELEFERSIGAARRYYGARFSGVEYQRVYRYIEHMRQRINDPHTSLDDLHTWLAALRQANQRGTDAIPL